MAVSDSEKTKNLTDFVDINTITKVIDYARYIKTPYTYDLAECFTEAKNLWIVEGNTISVVNFEGRDVLRFNVDAKEMLMKNITEIRLSFSISCNNDVTIEKVGISRLSATYTDVEIIVNDSLDVDVIIPISEVQRKEYISLIEESIFQVFIELSCDLIDTSIQISDIVLSVEHEHFLQDEIDAVYNRLDLTDELNKPMIMALGLGLFHIDEDGDLWVELPQHIANFFRIDENGNLIATLDDTVENNYHMDTRTGNMLYGEDN